MYMTAQRKLLFRYFSEHPDVSVTARQLCDVLNNGDQVKIGLSSIYRNLAALTKAGFIHLSGQQGSPVSLCVSGNLRPSSASHLPSVWKNLPYDTETV